MATYFVVEVDVVGVVAGEKPIGLVVGSHGNRRTASQQANGRNKSRHPLTSVEYRVIPSSLAGRKYQLRA